MSEERGARGEARHPMPDVRRPTGGFDDAIDRAVREMLDVEPPAGLRGRVLRRIETGPVPPAFGWRVAWLAVPLAAAALLIVALRTPSPVATNPVEPVSVARLEPPPTTPAAPAVVPAPRLSPARPARQPLREDRVAVAASYLQADDTTSTIEPLETINPIHVTPIAQRPVVTDDIAVRPLNPITEVQIAPLTPPDRRN